MKLSFSSVSLGHEAVMAAIAVLFFCNISRYKTTLKYKTVQQKPQGFLITTTFVHKCIVIKSPLQNS